MNQKRLSHADNQTRLGWRIAMLSLIGSLAFAATLLALALAGVSDPRPLGMLKREEQFEDIAAWIALNSKVLAGQNFANGRVTVEPQARLLITAPFTLHPPGTAILIAEQQSGDTTAGYGLWWGEAGASQTIVGVNSDGYLAALKIEADRTTNILPWRLFPHVRGVGVINKWQVDLDANRVTIWLNDERVTEFAGISSQELTVGLYAEASKSGRATFKFDDMTIWESEPQSP